MYIVCAGDLVPLIPTIEVRQQSAEFTHDRGRSQSSEENCYKWSSLASSRRWRIASGEIVID